jgi:hypothetical protein
VHRVISGLKELKDLQELKDQRVHRVI